MYVEIVMLLTQLILVRTFNLITLIFSLIVTYNDMILCTQHTYTIFNESAQSSAGSQTYNTHFDVTLCQNENEKKENKRNKENSKKVFV